MEKQIVFAIVFLLPIVNGMPYDYNNNYHYDDYNYDSSSTTIYEETKLPETLEMTTEKSMTEKKTEMTTELTTEKSMTERTTQITTEFTTDKTIERTPQMTNQMTNQLTDQMTNQMTTPTNQPPVTIPTIQASKAGKFTTSVMDFNENHSNSKETMNITTKIPFDHQFPKNDAKIASLNSSIFNLETYLGK